LHLKANHVQNLHSHPYFTNCFYGFF